MSLRVEISSGESIVAGFDNGDTTRVLFGELPPISTEQFCEYAAAVLAEALPKLNEGDQACIREWTEGARRDISGLPLRDLSDSPASFDDIDGCFQRLNECIRIEDGQIVVDDKRGAAFAVRAFGMARQNAAGNLTTYYDKNPYVFDGENFLVGDKYPVPPTHFAIFSTVYISGGRNGWSRVLGVPVEAELAISKLEMALSELPR